MAITVPSYQSANIPMQEVPGIRVQAPQAGAGLSAVGRGLTGLGTQMQERDRQIKEANDKTATFDALNQFRTWDREFRNNAETGVLSTAGKSAVGIYDSSLSSYTKRVEEIEGALENDEQRALFRQQVTRTMNASLDSISRHEAVQRKQWQAQTLQNTITEERDNCIANYTDTESMDASFDRVSEALWELQPGMDNEQHKAAMESFMSTVHTEKIAAMLNDNNPEMAQAYMKAFEDEISGKTRDDVRKAVREAGEVKFVQRESEAMYQKYGLDGEEQAVSWIRQHYTGDKQRKLLNQVEARYVDERRFEDQRQNRAYETIYTSIENAGSMSGALQLIERSGLSPSKQGSLSALAKQLYGVSLPKSDPNKLIEAQSLVYEETLFDKHETWSSFYQEFGGSLSIADLNRFQGMYKKKDDGESPMVTFSLQKSVALAAKSIRLRDGTEEWSKFVDSTNAHLDYKKKMLGRDLSESEKAGVIEEMAAKKVLEQRPWARDPKVYGYQIPPGYEYSEKENAYVRVDPSTGEVYDLNNKVIGRQPID